MSAKKKLASIEEQLETKFNQGYCRGFEHAVNMIDSGFTIGYLRKALKDIKK